MLAREQFGGGPVPSCFDGVPKKRARFRLENSNEVDGVNIGLVLVTLLGGELAFIALARKLIDVGLRLGIEAQLNEFACHLGCENAGKRVEQAVKYRCV